MSKYTPGPWMFQGASPMTTANGSFAQWGEFRISANSLDASDEDYYRIASVSNANDSLENQANARLIAAAPELLEALRGAVALADENKAQAEDEGRWVIRPPAMQAMYDKCVAAIAKATPPDNRKVGMDAGAV